MKLLPKALTELIDQLKQLPGVGERTAERLALHVLLEEESYAQKLAESLNNLHSGIQRCERCYNFSEGQLCAICGDSTRDEAQLAVVEQPFDIVSLEKTASFKGLYHVLGGIISPMDGIGPEDLNMQSLLNRIKDGEVEEVIIATNPSTEGEATALYIKKQLTDEGVSVTQLAHGLPIGSDLEYADQVTLGRALEGRQEL